MSSAAASAKVAGSSRRARVDRSAANTSARARIRSGWKSSSSRNVRTIGVALAPREGQRELDPEPAEDLIEVVSVHPEDPPCGQGLAGLGGPERGPGRGGRRSRRCARRRARRGGPAVVWLSTSPVSSIPPNSSLMGIGWTP